MYFFVPSTVLHGKWAATAGFIWTPNWLLGTRARPTVGGKNARSGRGGSFLPSPKAATSCSQDLKILILAELRPFRAIKYVPRGTVLILDTGFRYLLALNGRNFGINAHLAVKPTPRHQLKGPKPKGGVI
jgi:hypothetical protein